MWRRRGRRLSTRSENAHSHVPGWHASHGGEAGRGEGRGGWVVIMESDSYV